ncbi:serine protease 56 [Alligator mississippiensis]|uniref:serine protease 56 n=1 Tax=Alligator mississippiensis TaxID=8496 RepID=UPI0028775E12|nr:serine protease 56 [Alligator mississippiensis]
MQSSTVLPNTHGDQPRLGLCGHQALAAPNVTTAKGKIVGGSVAPRGAWPWLVSVRLDGELMCGGVLVAATWVLTAAHCFTGNRNELAWTVVVGDYNLGKQDEGEQELPVSRIITHPKFNPKTFHGDVALLELTRPPVPTQGVSPVCLPDGPLEPAPGTPCYITGWGSLYEEGPAAEVVMEARVPLLSQDACRGALGRDLLTSAMFCAGYLSGGIDSCQGDSGGPLTCQDPRSRRFVLYGITSWGDGCGERGKPGVYTRVAAFTDWIALQMQQSPASREPSCPELLALPQLPTERQAPERTRLCSFYARSCGPPTAQEACARAAQEACQTQQHRCEMRAYAQRLLDFLRRAEEFFQARLDVSFFTQALPRALEQLYTHLFPTQVHQVTAEQASDAARGGHAGPMKQAAGGIQSPTRRAGQPQPPSPRPQPRGLQLEDQVQELSTAEPKPELEPPHGEEQLFLQGEELQQRGRSSLQQLWAMLGSQTSPLGTAEPISAPAPNRSAVPGGRPTREKREVWGDVAGDEAAGDSQGCLGLAEAARRIQAMRELYRWVLQVPDRDLAMTFQEILVDLGSKNAKGLCRAQVRATVGGRATAFPGLVGLDSDSLHRSMPGLVAAALETLKT